MKRVCNNLFIFIIRQAACAAVQSSQSCNGARRPGGIKPSAGINLPVLQDVIMLIMPIPIPYAMGLLTWESQVAVCQMLIIYYTK